MPPITGLAEVVLSVRDLPGMTQFYEDVLGFSLFKSMSVPAEGVADDSPTIVFLRIADLPTPLGQHSHPMVLVLIDHVRHASGRDTPDPTKSTLHHLAFEIPPDTYDVHRENLSARQLEPREVEFPDISARALFFKDPEGNQLELICSAG